MINTDIRLHDGELQSLLFRWFNIKEEDRYSTNFYISFPPVFAGGLSALNSCVKNTELCFNAPNKDEPSWANGVQLEFQIYKDFEVKVHKLGKGKSK